MRSLSRKGVLLAVAFAAGLVSRVEAQGVTTGAISGFVADSAGAPLGGASVEIRYAPTGFRAATVTNARAFYLLQGLEPGGPYTVSARAIG